MEFRYLDSTINMGGKSDIKCRIAQSKTINLKIIIYQREIYISISGRGY